MTNDVVEIIGAGSERLGAMRRTLVVVAHPDDVESHCGGTVARLVDAGCRVTLLLATSGDKGSADPRADPAEVAARREAEQRAAAEILGIAEVVFLRWPDGEVENGTPLRGQLVRQVRLTRP
ncbi:MAG TPA: PIG-L family deacetylase, partial [Thermomicrobiaceae bacterium]|nr:PIG-L family deacetylase [Thermomicrobiaceae bacterium]